jgi:hypothetical protein
MVWAKLGTKTLTSAVDLITVSPIAVKEFIQLIGHFINGSAGTTNVRWIFNNNTNAVYARRVSSNGGVDGTATSETTLRVSANTAEYDDFEISYTSSILTQEKLVISFSVNTGGSDATAAPDRAETAGKFVPAPDIEITRVDGSDSGTGNYISDTNLSVFGTD